MIPNLPAGTPPNIRFGNAAIIKYCSSCAAAKPADHIWDWEVLSPPSVTSWLSYTTTFLLILFQVLFFFLSPRPYSQFFSILYTSMVTSSTLSASTIISTWMTSNSLSPLLTSFSSFSSTVPAAYKTVPSGSPTNFLHSVCLTWNSSSSFLLKIPIIHLANLESLVPLLAHCQSYSRPFHNSVFCHSLWTGLPDSKFSPQPSPAPQSSSCPLPY